MLPPQSLQHKILSGASIKQGLGVQDIVLEQLASSESVLSSDEKELGVAMIDIGGGTSDLAVFYQGSIKHTSVLTIAGSQMTNDIAIGLRTPNQDAEKIKHTHGCALSALVGEDETIEVPSVGGREVRTVSRKILSEILEARAREMFEMLNHEINVSGLSRNYFFRHRTHRWCRKFTWDGRTG